jgi:hypothetical protein
MGEPTHDDGTVMDAALSGTTTTTEILSCAQNDDLRVWTLGEAEALGAFDAEGVGHAGDGRVDGQS